MTTYNDLIIWQYRNKPKATAHIKVITELFDQAFVEVAQIPEIMNIETATGAALDLCGKRVGQSRVLNDFYPCNYFGFSETEGAEGFAHLNRDDGGLWYRYGNPLRQTVMLTDEDYRFLIKCKITKNFQTGGITAINSALQFIFQNAVAYDLYNMSLSVIIRNQVSAFKKYVIENLDILPRPAGVGVALYLSSCDKAFGFRGAIKGAGFARFSGRRGGRLARIL